MVARQHIPKEYSVEQLRILAAQMREWADAYSAAADQCEKLGAASLFVFNQSSLQKGLDALTAFINELRKSTAAQMAGNPIDEKTRKTRPKAAKQLGLSIAAEAKSEYDKNR